MKSTVLAILVLVHTAARGEDTTYPAEEIHDTQAFGDEAAA